jgi:hypothetical protein
MKHQHVIHASIHVTFVRSSAILTGLQNMIVAMSLLGGGAFFGTSVSGTNLFTFFAGALTLLALAAILRALWRWARWRDAAPLFTSASLRELHVAYWGLVLIFAFSAFALTTFSEISDNYRFLIAAWVSVAAMLGIVASTQRALAAVLVGVSLFGVLNIRSELAEGVFPSGPGANQRIADVIARFVTAHGANIGYSGYWDSTPVTWETHLHADVFPVAACTAPTGLCRPPGYLPNINTWYIPRPNVRSFLLTDTRPNVPLEVRVPSPSLGRPLAQEAVGTGLTVYVYDHDIAANLS